MLDLVGVETCKNDLQVAASSRSRKMLDLVGIETLMRHHLRPALDGEAQTNPFSPP